MVGLLVQPRSNGPEKVRSFRSWAADNGCFTQGDRFDSVRWMAWLRRLSPMAKTCLFATAPDVVGDAAATWARSEPFVAEIRSLGYRAALVAQDGMQDAAIPWGEFDAIFIGGSTEWKLSAHAERIVGEAKRRGMWAHMGRVNSLRRLRIANEFGCDSADGNFLGFAPDINLPRMLVWLNSLAVAA